MTTFILLLTLTLGGQKQTFVMDRGLTASDCRAALVANPHNPALSCVAVRA